MVNVKFFTLEGNTSFENYKKKHETFEEIKKLIN